MEPQTDIRQVLMSYLLVAHTFGAPNDTPSTDFEIKKKKQYHHKPKPRAPQLPTRPYHNKKSKHGKR